jgi:hypothetical protein
MPTIPLHPAVVHVPLGLALAVPLVALAIAALSWRRRATRGSFAVLALLQAVLVAGGVAAMVSGDRDEDRVERVVAERVIDEHEDRAELFVWAAAGVLGIAAAALAAPARALRPLAAAAAAGSLVVALLAVRVGAAGGAIVYAHGGAAAFGAAPSAAAAPEHDDD